MLTRDFSEVTRICPELGSVVRAIDKFLAEIPSMDHIEPERLLRIYPHLEPGAVYLALEIARDRRLVKRSWGVLGPNRCHAIGYWDRLSKIPKILYDTGDDRFRRADGQYIVVYRAPDAPDGEDGC